MTTFTYSIGSALYTLVQYCTKYRAEIRLYLVVELAVDWLSILVDHLEGVGAIAVHMTMAVGDAPVAKEKRDLVGRFRAEGDKVPEHVWVLRREEGSE